MINEKDRSIIASFAEKFDVKEIYLFGSSLEEEGEPNDIDLAVRGIDPGVFFDFYGKLLRHLSKSVDLVDLSQESPFTKIIEKHMFKIYEFDTWEMTSEEKEIIDERLETYHQTPEQGSPWEEVHERIIKTNEV